MFEQRYLNGEHLEQIPDWHSEESPWKVLHIKRILQQNQLDPRTVCEVGCGFGNVLKLLQEQMSDETLFRGYEISPIALAHAQEKANERLHFQSGDIADEPEAFFDLMLVLDVVEHVADYLGFLQRIRPKSTYKIIQVPLELSVQTILRKNALLQQREKMGHLHQFTKDTALQCLIDCGYEILDYHYTSSSLELPTHIRKTRLMRGPRKFFYALNKDLAVRVLGGYRLMVLAR